MIPKMTAGRDVMKALAEALGLNPPFLITRMVIDISVREVPKVYIERLASKDQMDQVCEVVRQANEILADQVVFSEGENSVQVKSGMAQVEITVSPPTKPRLGICLVERGHTKEFEESLPPGTKILGVAMDVLFNPGKMAYKLEHKDFPEFDIDTPIPEVYPLHRIEDGTFAGWEIKNPIEKEQL